MTTFLASQNTLKSLSNKFDGKIPVRVHFLDNSSKVFLVETNETVIKDVVRMCLDKYGVDDAEYNTPYFSLFESKNGSTVDGLLPMDANVASIVERWSQEGVDQTAKFLFMIRMFMPCIWGLQHKDVVAFRLHQPKLALSMETYLDAAETTDVNCLHLQFMQAVYLVITGKLPTKQEQALELGAIHFISKFGNYNSSSHQPGFLGARIVEFIPIKHLRCGLGGVSVEEWEAKLLAKVQEYDEAVSSDNTESINGDGNPSGKLKAYFKRSNGQSIPPQRKYMEIIYSMVPLYGCTFFKCTQRVTRVLPEVVQIGLHHHGLGVFDKSKRLVRMFHIEDIFRWGFKPNQMFYFEISAENDMGTGSLEFDTVEGKVMSDLLTDYAMAFLKEREREDERLELMKAGKYSLHTASPSIFSSGNVVNDSPVPPPLPSSPPPPPGTTTPGTSSAPLSTLSGEDKRQAAVVRMQALARGFLLRNDWAKEDSAILIQSIFRGYRARILLSQMIEELIQSGDL